MIGRHKAAPPSTSCRTTFVRHHDQHPTLRNTTFRCQRGGVTYTSIASLSTCKVGAINGTDVSLVQMTRLPKVFFEGKEALRQAVYVGTRHIHALDYEVWSLNSYDDKNEVKIVQDFYFTKVRVHF
ncbi:hypothetical protein AVEN_250935-1 [Araneus ventricosus]|uniref:LolA-like domain-containing protein n=1 Tax=Araneus ventricosus TaxID=182803 RepID=A0A4Y2M8H7_ARAVE|nr:hypothetical protein AVEN_250935-1 [Araneus ventricosus]